MQGIVSLITTIASNIIAFALLKIIKIGSIIAK